MTWRTLLKDFQNYLHIERGMSKNSIESYCSDIEKLILFIENLKEKISPTEIQSETLREFIYQISKYITARSQARLISSLKSFFRFLVFENYREDFPMEHIETPKFTSKLPEWLSVQQIDQLISSIDLSEKYGHRNKAILELLYSCGLRVSELISLKLSDLFFDEGFIKVVGKGNKSRFVPIAQSSQKHIELYLTHYRPTPNEKHQDFLFLSRNGKQLTRMVIFNIVQQVAQNIDLPKKISPHTFRHSFATHLLENGVSLRAIQMMLGHESISTTEIYVHMEKSYLRSVINQYHPRKDF